MEPLRFSRDNSALIASEIARLADMEQQLRRSLIDFIADLCEYLDSEKLMKLSDYLLLLTA
jgi:hypothetical protein